MPQLKTSVVANDLGQQHWLQPMLKKALIKQPTAACPADIEEWCIKANKFQACWLSFDVCGYFAFLTSQISFKLVFEL